jgi:zinc transporter
MITLTPTPTDHKYGSDDSGLVCGFLFRPNTSGTPLGSREALAWLAEDSPNEGEFIWLHFNLANVASERWLSRSLALSPLFFETLNEGSRSTRVEFADDQLIAVLNDVLFDFSFDPSDVSTLVLSVGPRFLVTARKKALRSVDRLRVAVKNGEQFPSPTSLLVHLLRDQADVLVSILRNSIEKVDQIEDRLLAGRVETKRAELGQLRRVLVRLKRLLAPEPGALFRLLNRPPSWMSEEDIAELRQSTEEFSVSLSDIDTLQERIKLLQEEISALVQEQNNRSLWVLSLFTVLALPVNMIAGFFGMNVGGVPLAQNEAGFAIVVSVVLSITVAIGWWILRQKQR